MARAARVLPRARRAGASTGCTSRRRSSSSATAQPCSRRSRPTSCAGARATSSSAGALLRIESELGVSWQAQLVAGALPEARRLPEPAARADVRPAGGAPVRHRPGALRPLPAQRAGDAPGTPARAGRRRDRARRGRRRPGRLRPRLRPHAGRARPALLPAVGEPSAAAAGDARGRRGGRRRGGARAARRSGAARVRRGAAAPPARATSCDCSSPALPGQRSVGRGLRRRAHAPSRSRR